MTNAVDVEQIELLKEIMKMPFFNDFYLAGGTNLALKYAHRHSIDLDLFIEKEFDIDRSNQINKVLNDHFKNRFESIAVTDIGVFAFIDNIKVDFVHFPYPMLSNLVDINGFRLASDLDIAAMKINAINGRGSRKDFYDIHLLFSKFGLNEMLDAYKLKFNVDNLSMALRSLVYFEDAEHDMNPNNTVESLNGVFWGEVKSSMIAKVKKFGEK